MHNKKQKVLLLILKEPWYSTQESGEKLEEYKNLKEWMIIRLFNVPQLMKDQNVCRNTAISYIVYSIIENDFSLISQYQKEYDVIKFQHAYDKTAPFFITKYNGWKYKRGSSKWGAELGKKYITFPHNGSNNKK